MKNNRSTASQRWDIKERVTGRREECVDAEGRRNMYLSVSATWSEGGAICNVTLSLLARGCCDGAKIYDWLEGASQMEYIIQVIAF